VLIVGNGFVVGPTCVVVGGVVVSTGSGFFSGSTCFSLSFSSILSSVSSFFGFSTFRSSSVVGFLLYSLFSSSFLESPSFSCLDSPSFFLSFVRSLISFGSPVIFERT